MRVSVLYLIVCLVAAGCQKDFVVKDISNTQVSINSPSDNIVTTANQITFWWQEVEGAESYQLQVVASSFANTSQLLIDTSVTTTKYTAIFQPGSYQWRLRAVNAGYKTSFKTFSFKIDTTSNLSTQLVNMLSPANGTILNNPTVIFKWAALPSASKYRIKINDGLVLDTLVSVTNLHFAVPASPGANTAFAWNVQALNGSSQSAFSPAPFNFTVDLKPPSAPSILSPANGAIVKDTIKLVWLRNNPNDVAFDSVYVATDSAFGNVISMTRSDAVSIRIAELDNLPPANSGIYYWWRLHSFDVAGNRSVSSPQRKFRLSP